MLEENLVNSEVVETVTSVKESNPSVLLGIALSGLVLIGTGTVLFYGVKGVAKLYRNFKKKGKEKVVEEQAEEVLDLN